MALPYPVGGYGEISQADSYPRLKQKPCWGNHFWARGYFVDAVGTNEEVVRRYVKYQEKREKEEEFQRRDYDLFKR